MQMRRKVLRCSFRQFLKLHVDSQAEMDLCETRMKSAVHYQPVPLTMTVKEPVDTIFPLAPEDVDAASKRGLVVHVEPDGDCSVVVRDLTFEVDVAILCPTDLAGLIKSLENNFQFALIETVEQRTYAFQAV